MTSQGRHRASFLFLMAAILDLLEHLKIAQNQHDIDQKH